MDHESEKQLQNTKAEVIKDLLVSAGQKALCDAFLLLTDKLGILDFEGLPVRDYLKERKRKVLEDMMISIENKDPQIAAFLQEFLDTNV